MPEATLYLFDGFNLLHAGGFADVRELRDALASFVAVKGARGVLVFDGSGADERYGPLEVRYAPHADTLLERLAAEHRGNERVCLVSSDAAVRGTSGQEVAKVSSGTFLADLEPTRHSERAPSSLAERVDADTRERLERLRRGTDATAPSGLADTDVRQFLFKGFVRLREAFPRALAAECRALLWKQLGLSPDEPQTWTRPVVRLGSQDAEPFRRAAHTPRLYGAFDQLVGQSRWRAQPNFGGSIPVRFPVEGDPGDAGWHVDHGFERDGSWRVNFRSDGRSLLMLFLFSDVGVDDAPTRIRVGSHLDVPAALAPFGDAGVADFPVEELLPNVHARELALATGQAGDVYICHPFLVHAADRHRGTTPRFLGQPGLMWRDRVDLDAAPDWRSPVEIALRLGLGKL